MTRYILMLYCLLFSSAASAHIVADPNAGLGGAYFKTVLRISHGCDGKPTTAITVTIPKDILLIKPQPKTGWVIDITKRKLNKPINGPHGFISEITTSITWRGGSLPDDYFDEFGLNMKLPEGAKTLYFPVSQHCGGESRNWNQVPGKNQHWHDLENPAPYISIAPTHASPAHH